MDRTEIIQALNADLADKLGAIIQYRNCRKAAEELSSSTAAEIYKKVTAEEMRQAERIAERIVQLGGEPTLTASPIRKCDGLQEMMANALDRENEAIGQCRLHIRLCADHVDPVSRLLLEEIMSEEEAHAYRFKKALTSDTNEVGLLKKWQESRDLILSR